MSLKEKINADLKVSMLARDSFSTNVLRGLKAAILSEEVAKNKREEGLDDSEIESVIVREVKKRNEAAQLLDEERANNELKEAEILSKYLPEMMNEEEVLKIVQNEVSKLDEKSPKQMGQVIGSIKAKYGNSIDGSMLAKMVKEELV